MDAYLRCDENSHLILVHGEVDLATADQLLLQLRTLAGPAPGEIALDLARVSFMDCAGLRALIAFDRHVRSCGGRLRLAGASVAVIRLLDLFNQHGDPRDILDPPTHDAPRHASASLPAA